MSEVAQALGLKLKAERERRGVSAQKMADDMHLDGWVIEALESGDYQRIGPSVYAKGHLKKYASLLGVSTAEAAAGSATPGPPPATAPTTLIRMRSATPASSNLPWPTLGGLAALVLAVAGILWWRPWLVRSGDSAPRGTAASRATAPASKLPAAEARPADSDDAAGAALPAVADAATPSLASRGQAGAVPDRAAGSAGQATAIPAVLSRPAPAAASEAELTPGVGRAHLRLSFSADSWVDVYDYSGRRIFAGKGRANSMKTIAGIAPFRVHLGFASGVQLQVNDRAVAIGPQFVSGDEARFEAGADGVLRRDSHPQGTDGAPSGAAAPRG
jgi:cytoskeleton protein RodZ